MTQLELFTDTTQAGTDKPVSVAQVRAFPVVGTRQHPTPCNPDRWTFDAIAYQAARMARDEQEQRGDPVDPSDVDEVIRRNHAAAVERVKGRRIA